MKEAKIIYGNFYFTHPTEFRSEKLKTLHLKLHKAKEYDKIFVTPSVYNRFWKKVSDQKFDGQIDGLFAKFNGPQNPLATPKGQALLKKKGIRHTSMSIGDIIEVQKVKWLVVSNGFAEIRVLSQEDREGYWEQKRDEADELRVDDMIAERVW